MFFAPGMVLFLPLGSFFLDGFFLAHYGLGVFCSRNGAFPSLRIIFPGLVFSVSGFGFLFLDLGFWFPAVFFVPLPVFFPSRRLFTSASNKIGR